MAQSLDKLDDILTNSNCSREEALKQICIHAQTAIPSANLVSLWRFNEDESAIISIINYDSESESFTSGLELTRSDFPVYFQNIIENDLIIASDARKHSATKGFTTPYFEPNNIFSLLDFILHNDFHPRGVICFESKGKQVEWTAEDVENIRIIATMISFCFEVN